MRTLAVVVRALPAAVALAAAAGCGDRARARAETPPPRVFAFLSDRGGAELERLRAVGARIDVVAPNWYALDVSTGALHGAPRRPVLASARERGVRVWPVVNVNTGGTREWARARIAAALRTVAAGADGVTLDMEELRPSQRDAFSRLVRVAAAAVHGAGRKLAVYVSRSGAAYDWRAIARHADLLLAAGYNESHAGSRPGPVTTRRGFSAVVDRALAAAGTGKAVPLLGAFGYRWPRGGRGELIASADALALRRQLHAPTHRMDGNERFELPGATVVYQTAAGLRARARDARMRGARWIGLFSLGREPPHFWPALPTSRELSTSATEPPPYGGENG